MASYCSDESRPLAYELAAVRLHAVMLARGIHYEVFLILDQPSSESSIQLSNIFSIDATATSMVLNLTILMMTFLSSSCHRDSNYLVVLAALPAENFDLHCHCTIPLPKAHQHQSTEPVSQGYLY